jgi:hypothetical protein
MRSIAITMRILLRLRESLKLVIGRWICWVRTVGLWWVAVSVVVAVVVSIVGIRWIASLIRWRITYRLYKLFFYTLLFLFSFVFLTIIRVSIGISRWVVW